MSKIMDVASKIRLAAAATCTLILAQDVKGQAFIGANFTGGAGATIALEPPDTMGSPGVDHFVQFINGRFSIFNKSTGASISSVSSCVFWGNAGITFGGSDARHDPPIFFDPTFTP